MKTWGTTDRSYYYTKTETGIIDLDERYSIFDFDRFSIDAEETEPGEFVCRFTPINGVHHAAAMWAQTCTVDLTKTRIKSESFVEQVSVVFTEKDDGFDVVTIYYGMDVI